MSSSTKRVHFDASGNVNLADLEAAILSGSFITTDGPAAKRRKVEDVISEVAVPSTPPRAMAKKACPRKPTKPKVKPFVFEAKVPANINPVWPSEDVDEDEFLSSLVEPPAKRRCTGLSTVPETNEAPSAFASAVWNAFYAPKTTSASNI
jgi:hypothetical protein